MLLATSIVSGAQPKKLFTDKIADFLTNRIYYRPPPTIRPLAGSWHSPCVTAFASLAKRRAPASNAASYAHC